MPASEMIRATKTTNKNLREYREDIVRMVAFTRDQGIPLPDDKIEGDIARLLAASPADIEKAADIEALLHLHGQLSKVVAPATPRSLAATEFPLTNYRARGTLLLLVILSLIAVLGLTGYIWTLPPILSATTTVTPTATPSPAAAAVVVMAAAAPAKIVAAQTPVGAALPNIQLNFLAAAALGSAFSGLLLASDFLKNRTFNPQYVPVYVLRLIIGLLAGMILANIGNSLITGNETFAKLGPGIIALLGGYSAQAVKEILDRLVEVLGTLVNGKDDAASKQRLDSAKDVLELAQAAAADAATPQAVSDGLAALLKKLQQ